MCLCTIIAVVVVAATVLLFGSVSYEIIHNHDSIVYRLYLWCKSIRPKHEDDDDDEIVKRRREQHKLCERFIYFFLFLNRVFTFFTIVLIVTAEFVVVWCLCDAAAAIVVALNVELSSLLLPILMRGSSGIFFDFLCVVYDVFCVVTVGTVTISPSDLNFACGWPMVNDFDFVCWTFVTDMMVTDFRKLELSVDFTNEFWCCVSEWFDREVNLI